ncbi:helix-turn-helix domain-containing protein [Glycomyces sp. L485]|uniref:helix-turn-helix domain-containing protein n=1 Tax=Glycomyces sp. L485 TaxID=2909235 RepID=UPI001F4AA901|nr:helix-turn-helix domain-containing protein [Glycomyces sp. L485]MCH7230943.1 helix-turn-helix domain-containing protein [Glycomyces sp. L485]
MPEPDLRFNLRPLRARAMMSQEELALKAGVGTRTIRDIESGRVRPQPKTLRLLVKALGLNESDWHALSSGAPDRTPVKPRELPRALAAFTGRERYQEAILAAVADGAAVVTIHGMAGVGKTSLAVWAAHALAPEYSDGQLFVDFRGFAPAAGSRPSLESVLTRVLRSFGLADQAVPTDVDEMTARYRSVIADRRVLLMLDNVASTEQVEALLPGTPGGLVLATSRRDLSMLVGAYAVRLEPPPLPEATAMLGAALADRITEEEAAEVAESCGRLPLAISLAAARLRSRPQWSVKDLLVRLADEDRALDELDMGHGVAAALNASYLELDADHRRLLRRLGLVPGDDVDVRAAAALCNSGEEQTAIMLEAMVDVHLAETRSPGRYRLHDLVRLYALKLTKSEDTEHDSSAALLRLIDLSVHLTYQAAARIWPKKRIFTEGAAAHDLGLADFPDRRSALAWYQAERGNLVAAVEAAERADDPERAWHLATAFNAFRMHDPDIGAHVAVNRIALNSARRIKDTRKEAYTLGERGVHLVAADRPWDALRFLYRSATLKRQVGHISDAAMTFANIGILHRRSGRFAKAIEVYQTALALAEEAADTTSAASIGVNLVVPLIRLGRLAEAERTLAHAKRRMDSHDDYNCIRLEGFRGVLARERGEPAEALEAHSVCLDACRRESIPAGATTTLIEIGEDLRSLGRLDEAVTRLGQAVASAEELADASLERSARNSLGRALTDSGLPEAAIGEHGRAAALARSAEDPYEFARAHHGIGDARARLGDAAAERRHLRRAARAYADCGVPEAMTVAERLGRA